MPGRRYLLGLFFAATAALAYAQTNSPTQRLRGTIESISDTMLILRERSGERIELAISPKLQVTEFYPVPLESIQPNTFVGVGAMPQADGTQRAIAVNVFPEDMRGRNEGHFPFNFLPQATMTNAAVAGTATVGADRHLTLRYPGGEKVIVVPPGTPVASFKPGTRDLLVARAGVSLTAETIDGKATVTRISAGRNGFAPAY